MSKVAVSNYYVWYGLRDERLVKEFKNYFNDGEDAICTFVIFTGGAGTGKTRVLSKLSTEKGYRFICPTNVSGGVMKSMLCAHNLYSSKTFNTDTTIYKHYGENLSDTNRYEEIIRNDIDSKGAAGNYNSLKELYRAYEKSFETICELRFTSACERFGYISKEKYKETEETCSQINWFERGGNFETKNEGIVDYLLASGNCSAKQIPHQLRYHTYVIDEAGRIPCLTGLLMIYYHRWVRRYYGCSDEKHYVPKLICVGSATQNKVINDTALPINDYSLITMIVAPFFKNERYISYMNSFNRRCDKGDIESSATLATLIEKLELGFPVSKNLKDQFLSRFSVPFFIPSEEDMKIEDNRIAVLGRLHIAKRHKVLRDLERVIRPYMTRVTVNEYFVSADDEDTKKAPYVYRPTEKLGSCYQSVTYDKEKWIKSSEKITIDKESVWKYENTRKLFLNTPYKITHPTSCTLVNIDGSMQDFLNDSEIYRSVLSNPETTAKILVQLIFHLNKISELIALYNTDLSEKVSKLPELIEHLQCGKEPNEEKIRRLNLEINTYMHKVLEFLPKDQQIPLKISLDDAKGCLLSQGLVVYPESIKEKFAIIRLGRSLCFRLFRKKFKLKGTSVTDFSMIANVHIQNNINEYSGNKNKFSNSQQKIIAKKRKIEELEDDDDWIERMIIEEVEEQQNVKKRENANKVINFYFFPLKLSMIATIDATQSETYSVNHIVELTRLMPASDLIVAITRLTDTNLLKVHIANKDTWEILPLDETTRQCVNKLYRDQIKKGWI